MNTTTGRCTGISLQPPGQVDSPASDRGVPTAAIDVMLRCMMPPSHGEHATTTLVLRMQSAMRWNAAKAAPTGATLREHGARRSPRTHSKEIEMRIRAYSSRSLAVAVAGCTVGPDYVRPAVDTPTAWRIDYPKAAEVANTKWWEQFGDPVLNELIETALRENRDVRIAAARVDQFIGALMATRSQLYPQLGYGADASRFRSSRLGVPAIPSRRRSVLHAVPGVAGRLVATRPVRPRAPPDRSGASAGLCERAGAARRRAVARGGRRDELHRAARTRPAARDRAGDGDEFRRDSADLRPAVQGRHRVADRSVADPRRSTSRRSPRFRRSSRRSPRRRT